MKTAVVILFLIITYSCLGQVCDTLEDRVINCIDENGWKQGDWENWEYQWRLQESNVESTGFCQTYPLVKVYTRLKNRGKYLNDKKIEKWKYFDEVGDYFSITKTEYYHLDGSVDVIEDSYKVSYNKDSSMVETTVLAGKDTIFISCENKSCLALFKKSRLAEFQLNSLDTEIDKMRWGIYAREIRVLNNN